MENNLKPGEYICDECKGTGHDLTIPEKYYDSPFYQKHRRCDKCLGEGKLDWVEAVVGKKNNNYNGITGITWYGTKKPTSPKIGQVYMNSISDKVYTYDGQKWTEVVSMTTPM